MNLRELGYEIVDWMHLAQDRDQWRAIMNVIMKLSGYLREMEFLY